MSFIANRYKGKVEGDRERGVAGESVALPLVYTKVIGDRAGRGTGERLTGVLRGVEWAAPNDRPGLALSLAPVTLQ